MLSMIQDVKILLSLASDSVSRCRSTPSMLIWRELAADGGRLRSANTVSGGDALDKSRFGGDFRPGREYAAAASSTDTWQLASTRRGAGRSRSQLVSGERATNP